MRVGFAVLLLASLVAQTSSAQQTQHHRHDKTGIEFDAPAGWNYFQTVALLDGGDQLQWMVPALGVTVYCWTIDEQRDAATIEERLDSAVERKVAQRRASNYRNYRIAPDSVYRTIVNGREALVATAEFETGRGAAEHTVIEAVAWIISPNAGVFLFAPAPADKAAVLRAQFDSFVASVRLP